jgi:GGDEF domain-containing protein
MDDNDRSEQMIEDVGRIPGILDGQTLGHLLDVELARARRYEHPFSLLRVRASDIDALRVVAGALRLHTRWADSVGVLDGKALLVILRDTPLEGAQTVAAKILESLNEELPVPIMEALLLDSVAWRKGDDRSRLLARLD